MKAKILGLLAVGLLAGPMAANATVTYTFDFSNLTGVTGGTGSPFSIALTYSDFVTTTGMQALSASFPTTLGYSVQNAGTNNRGYWLFSNTGGSISDDSIIFSSSSFYFSPPIGYSGGYYTSVGTYSSGVGGNAPVAFSGSALLTITSTAVPEPGTLALLSLGLVGLGLTRRRKAN